MIFFLIWVVFAVATALIADAKKRNVIGWFVLSIFIGAIATLIVACLPKIERQEEALRADGAGGYKTCPRCAETVKGAALVCRFCGHQFEGQVAQTAIALPWTLVEPYENEYGIYTYKGEKLTYTARGVKWQTSKFDTPAEAIAVVDSYTR